MLNKLKKVKGFTLIELIIVIAIIAILAAIAVPAFGQIRQKANDSTDLSNARTIYSVVVAGVADGTIEDTTTPELASTLKTKGLAETPKPNKKDSTAFKYSVTNGNVVIYIDDTQIYPTSN